MSSDADSTTTVEPTEARNLATTRGLREIADLLDEHPELPQVSAIVWLPDLRVGEAEKARTREELGALAAALGDRATETVDGNRVRVGAEFGRVRFYAEAPIADLGGIAPPQPPQPEYEPIIGSPEPVR